MGRKMAELKFETLSEIPEAKPLLKDCASTQLGSKLGGKESVVASRAVFLLRFSSSLDLRCLWKRLRLKGRSATLGTLRTLKRLSAKLLPHPHHQGRVQQDSSSHVIAPLPELEGFFSWFPSSTLN